MWTKDFIERWDEEARKAAKVCHVDESLRKAFNEGAHFMAQFFLRTLGRDPYEDHSGYPKAYMDSLTLSEFRATMEYLWERLKKPPTP